MKAQNHLPSARFISPAIVGIQTKFSNRQTCGEVKTLVGGKRGQSSTKEGEAINHLDTLSSTVQSSPD